MRMLEPNVPYEVGLSVGTYEVVVGGLETAYERRHLGTVRLDSATDGGTVETTLPEPKPFQLWVVDPKEDEKFWVHANASSGIPIRIDSVEDRSEQLGPSAKRVGVVQVFWRPAEPFALWRSRWAGRPYESMMRLEPASFDTRVLVARDKEPLDDL